MQTANLVLGQFDFVTQVFDASQQTMNAPFGLALLSDGGLAVSDSVLNRVLFFARPSSGDFSNAQLASVVFGQADFNGRLAGAATSIGGLAYPAQIASDSNDRLYVCDAANNRVMIFPDPEHSFNGAGALLQLSGFNFPLGVTVNPVQGDIWVANTNGQQLVHFPPYVTLVLNGEMSDRVMASAGSFALALDTFGNLISAELVNRVSFYFPVLAYRNTANYNTQPVAPGSLTYVGRPGVDFSFTPASPTSPTWPTTLGGLQVVMNGTSLCPIFLVTSNAVFFQVPTSAPTSGFADFQVVDAVTGQVYADSEVPMAAANPGFYTANSQGTGQAAAINISDGSINSASNPVLQDGKHYIQFYLTGLGAIPGAPPDGQAPSGPVAAPSSLPFLFLGTNCLNGDCTSLVSFSGLAAYPGVWVINLLVPNAGVSPGCNNTIAVGLDGNVFSNVGPSGKIFVTYCTK
jgi:uncharacterized protein (TIGR03437 family)